MLCCDICRAAIFIVILYLLFVLRYELAQQLQQQQSSNDMQPSTAVVGTGTQSMLEVVGDGQQVTLPTALGEDALQETGERDTRSFL